jgi:hypothetical protein
MPLTRANHQKCCSGMIIIFDEKDETEKSGLSVFFNAKKYTNVINFVVIFTIIWRK